MIGCSKAAGTGAHRESPGSFARSRAGARIAVALAGVLALGSVGCQRGEPPPMPAAVPATVAKTSEASAVKSMLLQYEDAGALLQHGFQIAEEGGVVSLEQFDRWTPNQLSELLQFVESPKSGLSESTAHTLGQTLRGELQERREAAVTATRSPPAPPRVAP